MKMYLIAFLVCLFTFSEAFASDKVDESKQRQELISKVSSEETQATQLIVLIRQLNNGRFSSDLEKGDAEAAYLAFLARFQSLKEDKSALEQKELSSSLRDLENYSERFDVLIKDLQKFLK